MLSLVISFTRVSMNSAVASWFAAVYFQSGGVVCRASTHVSKYDTWISRSYRCLAGRSRKKTARVVADRKLLVVCFRCLRTSIRFMINLRCVSPFGTVPLVWKCC
jgi:hypothetical protein